jgi:hypothetical protein
LKLARAGQSLGWKRIAAKMEVGVGTIYRAALDGSKTPQRFFEPSDGRRGLLPCNSKSGHRSSRAIDMNLSVLSSELFVIAVEAPSGKFKLFEIICRTAASSFPYFKHSSAQLFSGTLRGGQQYPSNLPVGRPLTMNRVKYTHHVDGEAHFSQDGKIVTKVR